MNNKLQCNVVNDLLPLYTDKLTSEETNSFIRKHLEECPNCRNEYQTFKTELSNSAGKSTDTKIHEIDYLKKVNMYQKMNFILGAVISFLFGACIPVLKVGIPVLLNGAIPDYYLARLQIAWHIGLLKMTVWGVILCLIYMSIMIIIRKKLNGKKRRNPSIKAQTE